MNKKWNPLPKDQLGYACVISRDEHKLVILHTTQTELDRMFRNHELSMGGSTHETEKEARESYGIVDNLCTKCAGLIGTHWSGYEKWVAKGICMICNFWHERLKLNDNQFIANRNFYTVAPDQNPGIGPGTGHGGAEFRYRMIGKDVIHFSRNVWSGGEIPKIWSDLFPDTAVFIPVLPQKFEFGKQYIYDDYAKLTAKKLLNYNFDTAIEIANYYGYKAVLLTEDNIFHNDHNRDDESIGFIVKNNIVVATKYMNLTNTI